MRRRAFGGIAFGSPQLPIRHIEQVLQKIELASIDLKALLNIVDDLQLQIPIVRTLAHSEGALLGHHDED